MVKAAAYAKVNLALEVLGRRADGYHSVTTVLQTVDLADQLSFEPASEVSVECSEPELSGKENLAWKAALALQEASGSRHGARIWIDKHIPTAMGLGGGSSDAGATLVALNRLWEVDLPAGRLEEISRSLGADVPFFVKGGTALGEGRGDILKLLKPLSELWVVLVCPEIRIAGKTGRLYSMLGKTSYTNGQVTRALVNAINFSCFSHELLFNVFEQVAVDAFPGLDGIMEDMNQAGADFVHLSGTGPALYTLVSSEVEGQRIRSKLIQNGHRAFLVKTTEGSPHLTLASDAN